MSLHCRSRRLVTPPIATFEYVSKNSRRHVSYDSESTEIHDTDRRNRFVPRSRRNFYRDVRCRSRSPESVHGRFSSDDLDLDAIGHRQKDTEEHTDSDGLQSRRSPGMLLRSGSVLKGVKRFLSSARKKSPLTTPRALNVSNNALLGQGYAAACAKGHRDTTDSGHSPTHVSTTTVTYSRRGRIGDVLNSNNNARRARRRSRSPPLGSPDRCDNRWDDGDYRRKESQREGWKESRKENRNYRPRRSRSSDRHSSDRRSSDRRRYTSDSDNYSYGSYTSGSHYKHKKKKKFKKRRKRSNSKSTGHSYFNVMPHRAMDMIKGDTILHAVAKTVLGTVILTAEKAYRLVTRLTAPFHNYILSPIYRPAERAADKVWCNVSQVVSGSIVLDTWIASRNIKKFCLYMLLMLMVFLLLGGGYQWYRGTSLTGDSFKMSSIIPESRQGSMANAAYYLHEEVKKILNKLKGEKHDWLSRADVESLVRGILTPALESLKVSLLNLAQEGSSDQTRLKVIQDDAKQRLKLLEEQMASLVAKAKILDNEMAETKSTFQESLSRDHEQHAAEAALVRDTLTSLKSHISSLQATLGNVADFAKSTCVAEPKLKEQISQKMSKAFDDVTKGGTDFASWLNKNYVDHAELNEALNQVTAHIDEKIKNSLRRPSDYTSSFFSRLTGGGEAGIADSVRTIVEKALLKYSADRTGLPDFALESAGGSVLNHLCSETYVKKTSVLSIFGIPLFYMSSSPRSVIQPEVMPGQCWAFTGDKGHMVIQLAVPIRPTAFSLEHIPKSLSIHGNIDSAPKDFTVIGLRMEDDKTGVNLGNFTYRALGTPIQSFDVQIRYPGVFGYVMLKVLSNYGCKEYTCLYRFRVHGVPESP